MVNTAELRQIFPLRGNTLRHVVEGDGRYPRAMTPSDSANLLAGRLDCFVRVTALVITGDVEACPQRLQQATGLDA